MLLRVLLCIFLLMMTVFSQTPTIETGVSQTLAKWRAAHYSNVRYKLNITLEKGAPLMKGDIEVRINLTDEGAKNDLILDWRTTQFQSDKDKPYVSVDQVNDTQMGKSSNGNDKDLYWVENEHLIIERRFLRKGENTIQISFASPIKTSGSAITRYVDKEDGAEYIYSLFVPSDASMAFPVFDQSDLRARFKLSATFPADWEFVTNTETSVEYQVTVSDCSENCELRKLDFYETKPISTYVFAFAAGNFETFRECLYINKVETKEVPKCLELPKTFQETRNFSKIYVRKSQAEKFKQHAAETFRLNREAVKYLESYFDFKFPFPKYDLVLIPEFPFGGMEHAGATFLRESSVIFPSEPTANDYISRANVIFHEAAHQWFGDTVTMKWFDDLWLKEGFAEFMAYKTLEKVMPEYNAWKAFYERNKPLAYLTDSTKGTTPIYQEIPNLSAAKSAYGNIVYRKAPSFLRQAEFYLGEDKFQTAVRTFLKKHQFANAEWTDLVKEFETVSKKDLSIWAKTWVRERGVSVISFEEGSFKNEKAYYLRQHDLFKDAYDVLGDNDEINFLREVNFNIFVKFKNGETRVVKFITSREDGIGSETIFTVPSDVDYIFPNYQDYGYGIFLLDEKSRAYVLENIQNEKDAFLRSMMWGTLWDSVREAELNPKDYVELAIKNISTEKDELTINTILGRVSTAMNYYVSDKERDELAPPLENLLIDKMQNAPTLGQRITFYRAFLNVASTAKARTILKDVLSGKVEIKNLKLKTKDKFDIVTKLAVLGDADAPQFLADLQKTETADDAKRYAYAATAGFASAENKAKFWNDFVNNKEISESWIEAAFAPFNSTRHAEITLPYLEKALAELPNLKRSRKIFFVNGWLAAFIGGQKSERAVQIVNKFLADNTNLDKDLRLKILENVDGLERSVKIRRKFASAQ